MSPIRKRIVPILKKTMVAVAVALLFAFLGIFDFVGYHASAVELSFKADYNYAGKLPKGFMDGSIEGSAESVMKLDLTYNPILQPFQWLTGQGCLADVYRVVYTVNGPFSRPGPPGETYMNRGAPSSSGAPGASTNPPSAAERIEYLILYLTAGSFLQNLFALLPAAVLVEASGRRWVYLCLFGGIFGFAIAGLIGLVVGLITGTILIGVFKFKLKSALQRRLSESSIGEENDGTRTDENTSQIK